MKRKILLLATVFLVFLIVAMPSVSAEEETWDESLWLCCWPENETVVQGETLVKGEQEVYQGGTFTYTTSLTITEWDSSLSDDYYLILQDVTLKLEYWDEANSKYIREKQCDTSNKGMRIDSEGKVTELTFEVTFPNTEDQHVEIYVTWTLDWHYITKKSGIDYIYTESNEVWCYIDMKQSHRLTSSDGGGMCLGTIALCIIPIVALVSLVAIKKKK